MAKVTTPCVESGTEKSCTLPSAHEIGRRLTVTSPSGSSCARETHEGRGEPWMGLLLGSVAALAARWTSSRLDQFDAVLLVRLLRGLAIVLAIDSGRRTLHLLML